MEGAPSYMKTSDACEGLLGAAKVFLIPGRGWLLYSSTAQSLPVEEPSLNLPGSLPRHTASVSHAKHKCKSIFKAS